MGEHFGNRQLEALQQRLADLERRLEAAPFARGVMSDVLTFTAGETKPIDHKLGRVPQGLWVVSASGAAPALYFAAMPTAFVARVTSDNAGAFALWFF